MVRRRKPLPDFLNAQNTDSDVSAIEQSLGIAPRETAPAVPAPPTGNPLLDRRDTIDFEQTPASHDTEIAVAETALDKEDAELRRVLTGGDFFSNIVGNDFGISALIDEAKEQGYDADVNFRLPELDSKEFKLLTQDIPEEHWDVFDNAVSRDHADWLAMKTRRELEAEREMAAYGGLGIAGRIATNLLDPVGVAVGVASGGLGWAAKGTRLTRAVKAGVLAGSENAAIQAALSNQRVEQDGWDVANAAFAGVVLGGLSSRFLSGSDKAKLRAQADAAQRSMDTEEAKAAAEAAGIDLTGTKWGDSGGSARVDESVVLRPLREVEDDLDVTDEVGQSAFAGARFDFASTLRGDEDEYIRGTLGLMVGEPVGVKSGVNHIGASERSSRLQDSWLTGFHSTAEPAYAKWSKAKGYSVIDMQSRSVRDEFMTTVGKYVDGSLTDADENIVAVGKVVRDMQRDILKRAKNASVDGFDDVAENERYLSRVPNLKRFREYEMRFGTGKMEEAIEESFKRGAKGLLDDDVAKAVAKGYVKRLKMQAAGFEAEMLNGLRLTDVDYIRGLLKDTDADSDTIDYVTNHLKRSLEDRGTGTSSVRHGKNRVSLDETARFKLTDQKTGELVEIGINDLFERNVEKLFGRYARTMSGHIGLAEVTGIKGKRDFDGILQNIKSKYEYADVPRRKQLEKVEKAAKDVYSIITGMPIEEGAEWHKYARFARDWNFTRTMNQVGFAQVSDMAGWMAGGYAREAMKHFPALRSIMKDIKAGKTVEPSLAQELKSMLSVATDYQNNTSFSFSEEMFMDEFDGAFGKVRHGVRVAGRVTQRVSGMKFINEMNQAMAGHVVAQKLIDAALGNTKVPAKRLLDMGLKPDMMKSISEQVKHAKFDSDGTLRLLNIHEWEPKAREAFLDAAYRESRRIVQEEDLGETFSFMHKSTGKLLMQFRRFAIASYTKQMLKGVHLKDARVATHWITSMMLGGAAFVTQQSLRLSTKTEEQRKKYVEQSGGWGGMFLRAGFSRANFSSLAPGAIDSVAGLAGTAVFNTRSSGLDSNFITGNPTYDLVVRGVGQGVLSGPTMAALRGDRQYKQSDAKAFMALLPFSNMVGVQQLLDIMSQQLPKQNEDSDPDKVDWF